MDEPTLVRTLRESLGLNQTEYAELLGGDFTQPRVSEWECGARKLSGEAVKALLRVHPDAHERILSARPAIKADPDTVLS